MFHDTCDRIKECQKVNNNSFSLEDHNYIFYICKVVPSTFIKQPVGNESDVVVEIVRSDWQVAPAASQLRAPIARQNKVQS